MSEVIGIGIVLLLLGWYLKSIFSSKRGTSIMSLDPELGQKSQLESIQDKVEAIKMLANNKKIPEKLIRLYEATHHYPAWLYNGNEYAVCSLVKEARELKTKENESESYSLTLKSDDIFKLTIKNTFWDEFDSSTQYGKLELFFNQKRVTQVSIIQELNAYYSKWESIDIDAYIDGEWVNTLDTLLYSIKTEEEEREYKEANSPEKISKLKEDFGIE